MKKENYNFIILVGLVLLGAMSRLVEFPGNFTAVGAIALFSGANFKNKGLAFLIPMIAMGISDLFLPEGFNWMVYSCFAVTVFIGILMSKNVRPATILGGSLAGSLFFFLVTNLPFWYTNPKLYTNDVAGAIASYTAALPFFTNSVLGDLFFNGIIFGSYYVIKKSVPAINN